MLVKIDPEWQKQLSEVFQSAAFAQIAQIVRLEYEKGQVFPPASKVFAAFDLCPFSTVKVVILGQDPYHDDGQANGLAFSVNPGVRIPPSLLNIYKEIQSETGAEIPRSGDLSRWAKQGVLLLNNSLTVRAHQPASHATIGWELLTDAAIKALSDGRSGLVFLLWGSHARRKAALIDRTKHLVLEAPHPSPLSAHRGFFGCNHFLKANEYLIAKGLSPILW